MTGRRMPTESDESARAHAPRFGLSGKLLLLTILFVMIAEVLIYVPSIANFRLTWLSDRVAVARTVALVLNAQARASERRASSCPTSVVQEILDSLGAKTVAMKMGNQRRLLAVNDMPHAIHHDIDLRDPSMLRAVWDALETLFFCSDTDIMRVVGPAPPGGDFVEIVIEEGPLRQAMFRFSRNILLLSLIISAITATLVYLSLHYLFVRPMNRLTTNMVAFREDPENPDAHRRAVRPQATRSASRSASSARCSATSPRCCSRRAISRRSASRCRRSTTTCATCSPRRSCSPTGSRSVPDPNVQRFAPQADALARARDRVLPVDAVLRPGAGAAARPPPVPLEALVEDVRETLGLAPDSRGALDRRGRARPARRCRPGPAVPRDAQPRAQCAAGAGRRARRTIPAATSCASPASARARWW